MKNKRDYARTRFGADVVEEAISTFKSMLPKDDQPLDIRTLEVREGAESWTFDTIEEFLSEYRRPHKSSNVSVWGKSASRNLSVDEAEGGSSVYILMPDRSEVLRLSAIFERRADEYQVPLPPPPAPAPPRIFIGHGGSPQWRDLKDHLHDSHGYDVEAFEVGARAGHVIRDILEDMLGASSFALLVHTGEDETAGGSMRARQNVIHETGLFQGRLGFSRALVLLEEGTDDYSNLQGVQQIRYSKGNIKETYGEVLATLRREFG